ncbi:uncharacterized protein LOC123015591 isoform X1 [Tribolium madens]|uniref:uncharacterized protein LOC123015591 isoform X1 n=1 Tax=Tribolium madens TaxID=41895 RepID=UPI001CF72E8C|nr:uncharacterized protein LOC123015591 isoform X1 [Tribolium madens]XP_044271333.1 uncharacterized protein LOC123015591 isoform X1 [Tribolium madens]XP_044271335.1 uncharacterized protein LOC123015591 isoform X1 [Tribolium madens]
MPVPRNLFGNIGEGGTPVNQLGLAIFGALEGSDSSGGYTSSASSGSSFRNAYSAPVGAHSKCIEHGHHHVTHPLNAAEQKQHDMFGCTFDPRACSEFDCDSPGDLPPPNDGMQHTECIQHGHHHASYPLTEEEQRKHEEFWCNFDQSDCSGVECPPPVAARPERVQRHNTSYPLNAQEHRRHAQMEHKFDPSEARSVKYGSTVHYYNESRPSTLSKAPSGSGSYHTALDASPSQVNVNISPEMATNINVGTPSFNLSPQKMSTPVGRPSFNLPRSKISTPIQSPSSRISGTSPPSRMASGPCGPHLSRVSTPSRLAPGAYETVSKFSPPSSLASGPCGPHLSRASTPSDFASGPSCGPHLSRASSPGGMVSGKYGGTISRMSTPSNIASGPSGSRISQGSPPSNMVSGPCAPHVSGFSSPSGIASGASRASSGGSSRYYTASSVPYMEDSSYVPESSSWPNFSGIEPLSPSRSLEGSPAPCGALYRADAVFDVTASGSAGQILQAIDGEHAVESETILSNLKRYQSARRKFMGQ